MTSYETVKATLLPNTAFGSLPKGDSLFGQICWGLRNRYGEERLSSLLQNYCEGSPFLVVSDLLPMGYIPRPTLPLQCLTPRQQGRRDRKGVKKKIWFPLEKVQEPLEVWLEASVSSEDLPGGSLKPSLQPHNSLHRQTGTTGKEKFAPYFSSQYWFRQHSDGGKTTPLRLEGYFVFSPERLTLTELVQVLSDIGQVGFGRDASIGLGKFALESIESCPLPRQKDPDAWMTLAPCAPQGGSWDEKHSFYVPFTRFGRHGDVGVHFGNPFKTPVLLADTGAILTPRVPVTAPFLGKGIGGSGQLSKAIPQTVHQGYAPVVGISKKNCCEREEG